MDHDLIVVGGSYAGLSAATYVARARRSVAVIDTGRPRNRFAGHSHGFFAQDGAEPGAILDTARAQAGAYPTVSFVSGEAVEARRVDGGFAVTLADGATLTGSRLVLAFGITDDLPAIPGLAERWGASVLHCPYCHGFEVAGRKLGVLATMPMSSHQAMLIPEWGRTTFFLNGQPLPDTATLAELERRGVTIETTPVVELAGPGRDLCEVRLADGRKAGIDALFLGPRSRMNSPIADQLGCAFDEVPFGRIVKVDAMKETSVPNVFAAGDITRGAHSIAFAVADGVMAGVSAHRSLVFPAAA